MARAAAGTATTREEGRKGASKAECVDIGHETDARQSLSFRSYSEASIYNVRSLCPLVVEMGSGIKWICSGCHKLLSVRRPTADEIVFSLEMGNGKSCGD